MAHGKFFEGDCYIVLKTAIEEQGQLSWDIHFWIGSKATVSKHTDYDNAYHSVIKITIFYLFGISGLSFEDRSSMLSITKTCFNSICRTFGAAVTTGHFLIFEWRTSDIFFRMHFLKKYSTYIIS